MLNRLRRKLREQKRKLQERLVKKGESFKESDELMCQERMFSLKDIKTQTQLEKVDEGEMLSDAEKDGDDSEIDKDTNGKDNKESDMEGGDDEGDDDDDGEGDDDEGGDEDLPESEGLEDTEDGMPALSKETGMRTNLFIHIHVPNFRAINLLILSLQLTLSSCR